MEDSTGIKLDSAAPPADNETATATKTDDTTAAPPLTFRRLYLPPLLRAPELVSSQTNSKKELYWDRSHYDSHEAQIAALQTSSTVYVGNLSFTTTSRHVTAHFMWLGPVQRVHMGLDRIKKSPCGFCFVQYAQRRHALQAVAVLSGTKLDGNIIRVELDAGFQPGRQYGRGAKGGQVRHDRKAAASDNNRKRQRSGGGSLTEGTRPPPPPPPPPPKEDPMASYQPSAPSLPDDGTGGADNYYAPASGEATQGEGGEGQGGGGAEGMEDAPPVKRQRTE